jgi:hypothetical protein
MTAAAASFDRFAAARPKSAILSAAMTPAAVRVRVELVELVLERALVVPGTQFRFGLDAVVGLVPVAGDIITGLLGAYLVWEARNLRMSRLTLLRMTATVGFDTLIGMIPFVGDAADLVFRSNTRNLRLIKRHLDRYHPAGATIDASPRRT